MPLEFALRPRFDLNRPPKRRRLPKLELHPLAFPVAAYWLALGGGTYALIHSRLHGSEDGRIEARSQSAMIAGAVPLEAPPSLRTPELGGNLAAPSDVVEEAAPDAVPEPMSPLPTLPPVDAAPREPLVLDRAPAPLPALPRVAPPPEPSPVARNVAPAPTPWSPFDALEEAAELRNELPNRSESQRPERRDEIALPTLDTEAPRREPPPTSLPSCESAADTANQIVDLGAGRGAPDLTRDAFAAVLENGSYLRSCAIPARTALEVCAAVQDGKVVGITVTSAPRDPAINACVRRAVAGLRFPRNSRLDVTRTRFEPAR